MEAQLTQLPTEFAPAARADGEELQRHIATASRIPHVNDLYDAVADIVVILNRHRQIVYANKALEDAFHLEDRKAIYGLRPGEALNCQHCAETPGGCGTTRFCRECGAVRAIQTGLRGKKATEECRLLRKPGGDALDLRVVSTPFTFENQPFVICIVTDINADSRSLRDIGRCDTDGHFLWVKADPTFEGLKQIMFEPEQRIFVGPQKPEEKKSYFVVDKVRFLDNTGDPQFSSELIEINQHLTTIIGGKSTGKSLLLYYMAKTIDHAEVANRIDIPGVPVGYDFDSNPDFNFEVTWGDGQKSLLKTVEGAEQAVSQERKTELCESVAERATALRRCRIEEWQGKAVGRRRMRELIRWT